MIWTILMLLVFNAPIALNESKSSFPIIVQTNSQSVI